jgi:transcriptional regulator with XRE-family HTH domain
MITTNVVVKQLREKLKLTQEEFAYLFGIHPQTVSKYERDKLTLDYFHYVLMSKMLESSISFDASNCFYSAGPVACFVRLCKAIKE